jgi:hypothetical protein
MSPARTGAGHRSIIAPGPLCRGALVSALAALCTFVTPVHAQTIKPWVPPAADSLVQWANEAKTRFRGNTGDSLTGNNFAAYDLVGRIGRRLLRSLGRDNMRQASAIKPILDSLGLETDIRVDPEMPFFSLLMVRNPYRRTANAAGFLFWYLEKDLRMQGIQFQGGVKPDMKVSWLGAEDAPYSCGIVDRALGPDPTLRVMLLRLNRNGMFWTLIQSEDTGVKLGASGASTWVDLNADDIAELVVFTPAEQDSLFDECETCPKRTTELVFVERAEGYRLLDTRLLPSPYATFTLFVRLLLDGNRAQAGRVVLKPELVQRAVTEGWGSQRAWRTWLTEGAQPGPWPVWLLMRFKGPHGERHYRVDFEMHHGRWVIRDWSERQGAPTAKTTGKTTAKTTGKPPGGAKPDSSKAKR